MGVGGAHWSGGWDLQAGPGWLSWAARGSGAGLRGFAEEWEAAVAVEALDGDGAWREWIAAPAARWLDGPQVGGLVREVNLRRRRTPKPLVRPVVGVAARGTWNVELEVAGGQWIGRRVQAQQAVFDRAPEALEAGVGVVVVD